MIIILVIIRIKKIIEIITIFFKSKFSIFKSNLVFLFIQGYPQRMRLQRRLYGLFTVCFPVFMIPTKRGI